MDQRKVNSDTEHRMLEALARIEATMRFARSPSLRRVLRYLVDRTVRGEGARLTPYRVAVEGFGRPPDFDPAASSSVRVEMNRLRRLLLADREEAIAFDGLIIEPASYRPLLVPGTADAPLVHTPEGPAVAVFPRFGGGPDTPEHIVVGLAQILTDALSRSRETYIVQPFDIDVNDANALHECAERYGCGYVLRGDILDYVDDVDRFELRVSLFEAIDATVLWSTVHTVEKPRIFETMHEIASSTAREVGDPSGVLTMHGARRVAVEPQDGAAESTDLLLRFHLYRVFRREPRAHADLRERARAAITRYPWFAVGWMVHGLTALDEYTNRFSPSGDREHILKTARASLERAVALDPELARAHFVRAAVEYYAGSFDSMRANLARALKLNPHDAEMLLTSAAFLCLGGDVEGGMALFLRSSLREHPAITYRLNSAVCLYAAGNHAAALEVVDRIEIDEPRYLPHLVVAIVCAANHEHARAVAALHRAFAHDPDLQHTLEAEIRKWILDPGLATATLRRLMPLIH